MRLIDIGALQRAHDQQKAAEQKPIPVMTTSDKARYALGRNGGLVNIDKNRRPHKLRKKLRREARATA